MRDQLQNFRRLFPGISDQEWDELCEQFAPAPAPGDFRPNDQTLKTIAALHSDPNTKPAIEWLLNITVNAPYPVTGQGIEELAFAAAKHQARVAVGETIIKAIKEGQKLIDNQD